MTELNYKFWEGGEGIATSKEVCAFTSAESCRERFATRLGEYADAGVDLNALPQVLQQMLLDIFLEDEVAILGKSSDSLDNIELSLAKDETLRGSLNNCRDYFGQSRTRLFHQSTSLKYINRLLGRQWQKNGFSELGPSESIAKAKLQAERLRELREEGEIVRQRLDGTYHALMSTMGIMENDRAIAETEIVSKLTNLAFFFIPLTLVASLFGMNLVVSWLPILCADR